MAHAVDSRSNNPANQLRELIDEAEKLAVKPEADTVERLLVLLDQIELGFETLTQDGGDFRPEQSRWESLQRRLESRPNLIARPASQAGGMDKLRAAHPPASSFWWRADEIHSARVRQNLKQTVTVIAIIVAAILIIPWLINRVFPPDPVAVAVLGATSNVERRVVEQDWSGAMAIIEEALIDLPNEKDLLLWGVVLAERLGDAEKAADLTRRAQELFQEEPVRFFTMLGMTRLRVDDVEGAFAAGEEAIALNPEDPQAYFLLGNAASQAGDINAALDYYEQTFNLAEENNPELAVNARILWGTLLQQGGMQFATEATPTLEQ